jgi:hypothetical protein
MNAAHPLGANVAPIVMVPDILSAATLYGRIRVARRIVPGAVVFTGRAWLRDAVDGRWRRATPDDLGSGSMLLVDAARGGYLPDVGWAPESRTPVPSLYTGRRPPSIACVEWVSLDQRLLETEEEARALAAAVPGLREDQREAVARAARFHDLGKCHPAERRALARRSGRPAAGDLPGRGTPRQDPGIRPPGARRGTVDTARRPGR